MFIQKIIVLKAESAAGDPIRIWSTNTPYTAQNPSTVSVFINDNGNLVMQDIQGYYIWQSSSVANPSVSAPYQLKLKNNGELILMDNRANIVWTSFNNSICILIKSYILMILSIE